MGTVVLVVQQPRYTPPGLLLLLLVWMVNTQVVPPVPAQLSPKALYGVPLAGAVQVMVLAMTEQYGPQQGTRIPALAAAATAQH